MLNKARTAGHFFQRRAPPLDNILKKTNVQPPKNKIKNKHFQLPHPILMKSAGPHPPAEEFPMKYYTPLAPAPQL